MEVNTQTLRTAQGSLECMQRYVRAIGDHINSANRAVSYNTIPQEIRIGLLNIESDLCDLDRKLGMMGAMVGEAGNQYEKNERNILGADRTITRCIGWLGDNTVIAEHIRFVPLGLKDHEIYEGMRKLKASLTDALFHK